MNQPRNPNGASDRPSPDQAEREDAPRTVDPKVLEWLICPLTKTSLEYRPQTNELISRSARLAFPIVDGIPLMTEDAARRLTDDDLS